MAANSFEAKRVLDGSGMSINHTPAGALDAGEVVIIGDSILGIAEVAIAAGVEGSLSMDGVFDMAKEATNDTFTAGDLVAWDIADNTIIAIAEATTGDKGCGQVTADAAATDATVEVLVFPIAVVVTAGS